MSSPFSLEDTLRRHDMALYEWLGGFTVDYGANRDLHELTPVDRNALPVLRVFSTPDRVTASVVDLLTKTGWVAGTDVTLLAANAKALREHASKNFSILPLPVVTIVRNDPTPNPPDSGVPKVFRRQRFSQTGQTWEQHRWPGAYETTYAITFWCLKRYTEVFFREWVYSKLGNVGVAESEALVPVVHAEPWGTIPQRLVFEGSSDLSDLEGEEPRYMRFEYTFRLRTWHFRPIAATTSYVHDLAVGERPVVTGELSEDLDEANPPTAPVSLNLFSIYLPASRIPTHWPKLGNATVKIAAGGNSRGPLRLTVKDSTDEVMVSNRAVPLDNQGRAVLSLAALYRSSSPVNVAIASRDPAIEPVVWIPNRRFVLPTRITPTTFQFFTLIAQPIFSATVQGQGTDAITYLSDVSLVHVRTQTRTLPDSSTPSGPDTIHSWSSLGVGAHLVVLDFGAGAVAGTIDVDGVMYSIDPALEIGLVAIFTPVAGALTVTVPNVIPLDTIYAHPFLGAWRGTQV